MRLNRYLLLLVVVAKNLIFPSFSFAGELAPVSILQQPSWYFKTDLTLHPRIITHVLPNGMRYIMVKSQSPKNNIEVRMLVDAGSEKEIGPEPGVAHFLEHMAFNGSKHIPEGEMIAMLERNGLAFGAHNNASTNLTNTEYLLSLPSASPELLDTALFIMRETATNLTLSKAAIDRERGVLKSEVRGNWGPYYQNMEQEFRFLFPGINPNNMIPVGTIKGMENVDQMVLKDFYSNNYTPNNTTLIVTGDINVSAVKLAVKKHFADWKSTGVSIVEPKYGTLDVATQTQASAFFDESLQTTVSINVVKPVQSQPDSKKLRFDNMLLDIAYSILSSRIHELALNNDELVVDAAAYYERSPYAYANSVKAILSEKNWRSGLAEVEQRLRQTLEFGVSQQEVDRALTEIKAGLENAVRIEPTVSNALIAEVIVNAVNNKKVVTDSEDDLEFFNSRFSDTTAEQVSDALRSSWQGAAPRIYMTSSQPFIQPEKTIIDAYAASQIKAVTAYKEKVTNAFGYDHFGKKGDIVAKQTSSYGDIESVSFDNGIVLNFKHTDFDKGQVLLSLNVGHGYSDFPTDKDGLLPLFNTSFVLGGVGKHTFAELERMLAGKQVSIYFNSNEYGLGGDYMTTPDDLKLQLKLLVAYLTDPAYRPEGEFFYKKNLKANYKTFRNSPYDVIDKFFIRTLHGNDNRWGFGAEEEMAKRHFAELKPVLDRIMMQGPVEIGIVGDIDKQTAIDAVAETFAALPLDFDKPSRRYIKGISFPSNKSVSLTHKADSETVLLNYYWKTRDNKDVKTMYQLQLLGRVLSLRLTEKVRESMGAAYSPQAYSFNSDIIDDYGYIMLTSEIKRKDIDKVEKAYESLISDLKKTKPVTEDELLRARKPVLEYVGNAENSNALWFDLTKRAYSNPDRIDRYKNYTDLLKSVTVDDITKVANKYLTDERKLKVEVLAQ